MATFAECVLAVPGPSGKPATRFRAADMRESYFPYVSCLGLGAHISNPGFRRCQPRTAKHVTLPPTASGHAAAGARASEITRGKKKMKRMGTLRRTARVSPAVLSIRTLGARGAKKCGRLNLMPAAAQSAETVKSASSTAKALRLVADTFSCLSPLQGSLNSRCWRPRLCRTDPHASCHGLICQGKSKGCT